MGDTEIVDSRENFDSRQKPKRTLVPAFVDRDLYCGLGRYTVRRGRFPVHDAFSQTQQVRADARY